MLLALVLSFGNTDLAAYVGSKISFYNKIILFWKINENNIDVRITSLIVKG